MVSTDPVETIRAVMSSTLVPSLTLMAVLLLLVLLVLKEIATSLSTPRAQRLSAALNIALLPLLLACAFAIAARVIGVLR